MLCRQPFARTPTGIKKLHMVTSKEARLAATPFPCGQCLHCRINKSRIWTTRLLLESMTSIDSTFITLTYNDDHIPKGGTLDPDHLKNFLKRFRRRHDNQKFRYYAVGEYGGETLRPHYHLAMFSDGEFQRCLHPCDEMHKRDLCKNNCKLSLSWNMGNIGLTSSLNKDLARYLTKYITNGVDKAYRQKQEHLYPEFMRCSKSNGGIGSEGIRRIAKKLKCDQRSKQFATVKQINIGGKFQPIGGHLTSILANSLGIDDTQRENEFRDYQEEIFEEFLKDDGQIILSLLDSTEGKRHSQEERTKLYKQKGTI